VQFAPKASQDELNVPEDPPPPVIVTPELDKRFVIIGAIAAIIIETIIKATKISTKEKALKYLVNHIFLIIL